MARILKLVLFITLSFSFSFAAQRPSYLQGYEQRAQFLLDVAEVLEQKKAEIIPLLNEIGALPGAQYEVEQSIKALRGAPQSELNNFKDIQHLKKIVIYGSSNIPLYTLTLQVIIPSLVFDQVIFKVSSKTKSVYQRLWDIIRQPLANKYHLGELLTSNSRLSSTDLMMDHITGKTPDGVAADVVVFTGNPLNGDELIAKASEALRDDNRIKNHRILFLKFGAGMNPVVIDRQIGNAQLGPAINASLEHFLVNSGQDCISPNFTLLPIAQRENAIRMIQERVAKIRYGDLKDSEADYSDLTFGTQKTIAALAEFKEKYKRYLVTNPAAAVDPISKRVDPHVFVMPGRLFKQLPLDEFYAPFAVFFTYESEAELKEMIHDPRLAKKAMFASLFGSEESASFKSTRSELIRTRHLVFQNASVFSAEDGNRPFGGFGSDVSTVNYIDKKDGVLKNKQFVRPLLISKEIRKGFTGLHNNSKVNHETLTNANPAVQPKNTFSIEAESSTKAVVHLERKAVQGFTGFSRFISTYSVLNRLVAEQQKYFASKFSPDLLPASQFFSTRGGLLSEEIFVKTSVVEQQILNGQYSKVSVVSEGPVQLHVDDVGDVTITIEGSAEEVSSISKLISQALSEENSFFRYAEFERLSGLNPKLASLKLQQFIDAYEKQFPNESLKDVKVGVIARFFDLHPRLGSFLFPIQKWANHPILTSIETEEKQATALEAYMKSTARYLQELNRIVHNNLGEKELRQQMGLWVWGVENKKFSELIGPWNSQIKNLKNRPKVLRCEMLFAL